MLALAAQGLPCRPFPSLEAIKHSLKLSLKSRTAMHRRLCAVALLLLLGVAADSGAARSDTLTSSRAAVDTRDGLKGARGGQSAGPMSSGRGLKAGPAAPPAPPPPFVAELSQQLALANIAGRPVSFKSLEALLALAYAQANVPPAGGARCLLFKMCALGILWLFRSQPYMLPFPACLSASPDALLPHNWMRYHGEQLLHTAFILPANVSASSHSG